VAAWPYRTGRWQALVTGHAAAPMLWWHEWVDHNDHFAPFAAISAFVEGEDLRGERARSIELAARSNGGAMWCRAWLRPGRLLIYAQDLGWALRWGEASALEGVRITVGQEVSAGPMRIEWWNADTGTVIGEARIEHPGGRLTLGAPRCVGHIAAKLYRVEE